MPLVPCPDCRRDISDAAIECVGCGRPMGVPTMMGRVRQIPRPVQLLSPVDTGLKLGLGMLVLLPVALFAVGILAPLILAGVASR